MEQAQLENVVEKVKKTRSKPIQAGDQLLDRLHNLEELVTRMAHQSGVSHTLIVKAGLEPYKPTKDDMSKFKKVAVKG